ncbi:MAG TPA: ABC transporter permease, partial [Polyangiaceae bacterium]
AFAWDSPPESLRVPPETGLLALTLRGASVPAPVRDAQGTVFLQKTATTEEGEKLEILVHRKLTDDIPLMLTTHLELDIAGKSREVLLGKALPVGFVPMSLDTQLPARLEQDSRLRVQVRPGRWSIDLVARSEAVVTSIKRPAPDGPWREGEEVWTFEAKPDLRLVDLKGPSSIDPAQTSLPEAWKRLPAYPMKVGDVLTFEEKRRGDADPPPNQLTLARNLWLDFDGSGYTISDTLTGTLNRDSRLEMDPPTTLGRVAIGGRDQFITHLGDPTHMGVEVRQGSLSVTADSRLVGDVTDIPAVGWKHDFHQVSGTLHLPPGWRLLHASGVDEMPSTWVREWSLLQIFLGLILAIAIGRLHGWRWGGIALVMLALTLPEDGAPRWSWIFVLAGEALVRVLPAGIFLRIAKIFRGAMLVLVALLAIPFMVRHVREGMYPVLAGESISVGSGATLESSLDIDGNYDNKEGGTGVRAKSDEGSMGSPAFKPPGVGGAATSAPAVAVDRELEDKAEQKAGEVTTMPTGTAASSWAMSGRKNAPQQQAQFNTETYDPNAVVQTGPGLPP